MIRFVIMYCSVGVMGSIAVFFSVPMMKSTPPPPLQVVAKSSPNSDKIRKQREKELAAAKAEIDAIDAAEAPSEEEIKAKEKPKPRIPSLSKYNSTAISYIKRREWETALKVIAKGLEHYPDNYNLLKLKQRAEERGMKWAAVWKADAPIYNSKGKRQETLSLGTLIQVKDIKKTRTRTLYVCDITDGDKVHKDVLINTAHVTAANGILADKTSEERKLLITKAEIKAKIYDLETLLKKEQLSKNPYASSYKKAKDEYNAFSFKANELVQMRDNEPDSDKRIEYADQLRQMQAEGLKLEAAYNSAKKDFDKHNKTKGTAKSPEIDKLKNDLAVITSKLRG